MYTFGIHMTNCWIEVSSCASSFSHTRDFITGTTGCFQTLDVYVHVLKQSHHDFARLAFHESSGGLITNYQEKILGWLTFGFTWLLMRFIAFPRAQNWNWFMSYNDVDQCCFWQFARCFSPSNHVLLSTNLIHRPHEKRNGHALWEQAINLSTLSADLSFPKGVPCHHACYITTLKIIMSCSWKFVALILLRRVSLDLSCRLVWWSAL